MIGKLSEWVGNYSLFWWTKALVFQKKKSREFLTLPALSLHYELLNHSQESAVCP